MVKSALGFLIPFLIQIFWDQIILKRAYYVGTGDVVQSYIGMGLSLADGFGYFGFPAPAGSFQMLAMAAFKYLKLSEESFDSFHTFSILFSVLVMLGVALWCGRSLQRLRLSFIQCLGLGALCAAFPTHYLFSATYSMYFICSILSTATLIVAYEALNRPRIRPTDLILPISVLGFIAANSYLFCVSMALPAIALLAGVIFFSKHEDIKSNRMSRYFLLVNWIFIWLFSVWNVLFRYRNTLSILILAPILLVSLSQKMRKKTLVFLTYISGPFVFGWFLGAGHLSRSWLSTMMAGNLLYEDPASRFEALTRRIHDFFDLFPLFYSRRVLEVYPYLVLTLTGLITAAICMLYLLKKYRFKKLDELAAHLWVPLLILVSGGLVLFTTGMLLVGSTKHVIEQPWRWALNLRYFIPLAAIATLGSLAFQVRVKNWHAKAFANTVSIVLFVTGQSYYHYAMSPAVAASQELNQMVSEFLNSSQNQVLCSRVTYPEVCSASYSRSYYRDPGSFDLKPRKSLRDGRVLEIKDLRSCAGRFQPIISVPCFLAQKVASIPNGGRRWIIFEDSKYKKYPIDMQKVWTSEILQIAVFESI